MANFRQTSLPRFVNYVTDVIANDGAHQTMHHRSPMHSAQKGPQLCSTTLDHKIGDALNTLSEGVASARHAVPINTHSSAVTSVTSRAQTFFAVKRSFPKGCKRPDEEKRAKTLTK